MKWLAIIFLWFLPFVGICQHEASGIHGEFRSAIENAKELLNRGEVDSAIHVLNSVADLPPQITCGNCLAEYEFSQGHCDGLEGQYKDAIAHFKEALAVVQDSGDVTDQLHLNILEKLGRASMAGSDFPESEAAYLRALDILKKRENYVFHPSYLLCLRNLLTTYHRWQKYDRGKEIVSEIVGITEKIYGKVSKEYAIVMSDFGAIEYNIGNYQNAESAYLIAESTQEEIGIPDTVNYCGLLLNIGLFNFTLGRNEEAINYYNRVKLIFEEQLKDTLKDFYASCLFNLVLAYQVSGQHAKAIPLAKRVNRIDALTVGRDSPLYADGLAILAISYIRVGDLSSAETVLMETLDIYKRTTGLRDSRTARVHSYLGKLYLDMGDMARSESNFKEADHIYTEVHGRHNLLYALNWEYLEFLLKSGKYSVLSSEIGLASNVIRSALNQATWFMSDYELARFVRKLENTTNVHFSFHKELNLQDSLLNSNLCDDAIMIKGAVLNRLTELQNTQNSDDYTSSLLDSLREINLQMYTELTRTASESDSGRIHSLKQSASVLEKQIVRDQENLKGLISTPTWTTIRAQLAKNEVAIEFYHYLFRQRQWTDSIMYCALIIKPDLDYPVLVNLFEEMQLRSLITESGAREESIYSTYIDHGAALYQLIWHPLEEYLEPDDTIYVSMSGMLNRLNLGAVPLNEAQSISDVYQIVMTTSTIRATERDAHTNSIGEAVLLGGITYDIDTSLWQSRPTDSESITYSSDELLRGFGYRSKDESGNDSGWRYLSASNEEIRVIDRIMRESGINSEVSMAVEATEEFVKNLGKTKTRPTSPSILHFSTHGFFFPDQRQAVTAMNAGHDPIFKLSDHPMIRSGLILAGGNYAWRHGHAYRPGMEDGILTAYEISQMDLSDTELVVLSACETGLGDIEGNEGVYGLQRAFKIAGVKNLIMSLWQVPDKATAELMTMFYENWLIKKMTIRQALHAAQKTMREKGYEHFYWAGFVLVE